MTGTVYPKEIMEQAMREWQGEPVAQDTQPRVSLSVRGLIWMTVRETDAVIRLLPHNARVLEIGTASGATAALISDARQDVTLLCVDTFAGDNAFSTDTNALITNAEQEGSRFLNWLLNKRPKMNLWVGTADELFRRANTLTFDVIIVDASHKFNDVYDDLVVAMRMINSDGLILAHDYEEQAWPEVRQAVDEFCLRTDWQVSEVVHSLAVLKRAYHAA